MSVHCFTYGTLMCPEIMSAVSGRALGGEPATLLGYSRHAVRDQDYPGIKPVAGARVQGVLYRNLDTLALRRLDAFEGEQYQRATIEVILPDGHRVSADTYVIKPEHASILLPGEWDFDSFLAVGKARFQSRYPGFSRI
ncbi:MAG: gamma-glutamylcyclotransferase [Sphingobacteriia bacterium]|nr:gamma-glutamylcyclotransferase [Sphingobacteriia bacterium]NCC39157.1 gamma-glutamylcyclotransferase [Gammaproteobacteria bacterium]